MVGPGSFFGCPQLAKLRIVRGIYMFDMLLCLVCYKPTSQCFPDCGVWVTEDFDSKYKILWGETRAHVEPIHEEEQKFKSRIYIILSIFPLPYLYVSD